MLIKKELEPEDLPFIEQPDIEQIELTRAYIRPFLTEIVQDLTMMREKVDPALAREYGKVKSGEESGFPAGYCREIRDTTLVLINRLEERDGDLPIGLQALANFKKNGGLIKGIWGIKEGRCFQNAIQVGDCLLDVANDTVEITKLPVLAHATLLDIPIEQIDNYSQLADIMESYWGYEIVPNIYLPELAPYIPFLCVSIEQGAAGPFPVVHIESSLVSLLYLESKRTRIKTDYNFNLAKDFIFKSEYAGRRLPAALVEKLEHPDSIASRINRGLSTEADIGINLVRKAFGKADPDSIRDLWLKFINPNTEWPLTAHLDKHEILNGGF